MFLPRSLQRKGFRESQKDRGEPPAKKARFEHEASFPTASSDSTTAKPITDSPSIFEEKAFQDSTKQTQGAVSQRGPRFTAPVITDDYLSQLVCGIELIFTDHAHQDEEGAKWLKKHYRVISGENKFIHLSSILNHPIISTIKPEATQILLRRALQEHSSKFLETVSDGYFVRRRPSTYPFPFIPKNALTMVNGDGLSFWDQRTIYVEPHVRNLCHTPAKVSWWLKEHGQLREKWLPIQAVRKVQNSCAFVLLSGNVMHENMWKKWRDTRMPEDWNIMTKAEHTKRTNEYLELLKVEKRLCKGTGNHEPDKAQGNGHSEAKGKRKKPTIFGRKTAITLASRDASYGSVLSKLPPGSESGMPSQKVGETGATRQPSNACDAKVQIDLDKGKCSSTLDNKTVENDRQRIDQAISQPEDGAVPAIQTSTDVNKSSILPKNKRRRRAKVSKATEANTNRDLPDNATTNKQDAPIQGPHCLDLEYIYLGQLGGGHTNENSQHEASALPNKVQPPGLRPQSWTGTKKTFDDD
ncbi:hypothetical protein K469DRAFT_697405 [Zopfia rhizophila CBS 207.26]|uniref:Uncharacterized protein n=1 Tax=Zopfia rhizophila CBS 207.26 TaxID=1314779 RepID=A0A6A6DCK1_9PEZI|nr:hypothetical protein K469DRAFT_697405 [Zopfia rhizophila CBS 207.26]